MKNWGRRTSRNANECAPIPEEEPAPCLASRTPRPTNLPRRYVQNIPPDKPNPDVKTGIRRKMALPAINFGDDGGDCYGDEETDEGSDCGGDYYGRKKGDTNWPYGAIPGGQQADCIPTAEESAQRLQALIDTENQEIAASSMYVETVQRDQGATPKTYQDLLASLRTTPVGNETILDSEMEPEMAAAMLTSEGVTAPLKHLPPSALYGRLFPEDRNKPKMRVTAASKRRRGAAVPVSIQQTEQLFEDQDAGMVDFYEIDQITEKTSKPIPRPVKHEAEGDADELLGLTKEEKKDEPDSREPYKYIVDSEPPLHGNYVQLRGSEPPYWFPGFFTVTPAIPELTALNEPNEALEKAWSTMKPTQINSPYGNILLGAFKAQKKPAQRDDCPE